MCFALRYLAALAGIGFGVFFAAQAAIESLMRIIR